MARPDHTTIEVPTILRDRLAAMRIHPRQALYELVEDALDVWDDLEAAAAPSPRRMEPSSADVPCRGP